MYPFYSNLFKHFVRRSPTWKASRRLWRLRWRRMATYGPTFGNWLCSWDAQLVAWIPPTWRRVRWSDRGRVNSIGISHFVSTCLAFWLTLKFYVHLVPSWTGMEQPWKFSFRIVWPQDFGAWAERDQGAGGWDAGWTAWLPFGKMDCNQRQCETASWADSTWSDEVPRFWF